PATGTPWYESFPHLTIRDIATAHALLADYLKIDSIAALIGSSVGGFQAVEWAVMQPERFKTLILIATNACATPWNIAINETQRMAIMADSTFGEQRADAGRRGLEAARAIGMLSYRGSKGYNSTQQDKPDIALWQPLRAATYQQHQGKKLADRFDAYSYVTILNTFDTHNVGRGRGGIVEALSRLSMPVLTVGITTDIIFTPDEMRELSALIPRATYQEIESAFGHDGFLVEHDSLNTIITDFFTNNHI
ncbi:MAG: alpha/beta fold hydrolase, partial [Duncaniella sp.]|nr:alpha/beta fold hydrolase [Duncaniella sp.]